jgi:hypothetical protein
MRREGIVVLSPVGDRAAAELHECPDSSNISILIGS